MRPDISPLTVLRAVFLSVALALLGPALAANLVGVTPALADSDDDDDDDDGAARAARPAPPLQDYVPDEVLLINPSQAALERSRSLGFADYATETLRGEPVTVARLRPPPGLDAAAALALLRREVPDEISDLNHLYRLQRRADAGWELPNCPSPRCYGRTLIRWSSALSACSNGIKVGVLDTGIDVGHPSLRGQSITTVSFVAPPARASDTQHGTGIVALLAGNGEGGMRGLLPGAEIVVADVFYMTADGRLAADALTISRGLSWLVDQHVSVINVSLAGSENRLLETAVKNALRRQVAVVAAAGNDGPNAPPRYPAALPGVVAVTAIDQQRRVYRRAASGAHIAYAAPGVNIWTAQPRGRYGAATGTSYAAPFATAVLGLIGKEQAAAKEPETEDLGEAGRDPVFGKGLIRAPSQCTPTPSRT